MTAAECRFTVFTPTYNRALTIHRPYRSLCRQTNRRFEWLVIDDGSTDNTAEVVAAWQKVAPFPIRYLWQPNASKAAAWNRALQEARGEFFVCLDSDDECAPHALETFMETWGRIPPPARTGFSGVSALTVESNGQPLGPDLRAAEVDCSPVAAYYRFRLGEIWHCYRTDVARRYPFELIPGYAQCLFETTVINRMALVFKQRYINQRLRVYHTGREAGVAGHLSAGVSRQAGLRHAPGLRAAHLSLLRHHCRWLPYAPVKFYKAAANYIRFSNSQGIGARAQFRELASVGARVLWALALPMGAALSAGDRRVRPATSRTATPGN